MKLTGLDNFFDKADENTTRRISSVDTQVIEMVENESWHGIKLICGASLPKVLRSKERLVDIKRFVNEQLQAAKKSEVNKTIYWPKPYGREMEDTAMGVKFTIKEDVKPYLNEVQVINNYLEMGMHPNFCINAQIDRSNGNVIDSSEAGLKKVKENRDCYLHYTILAYTGFFTALQRQKLGQVKRKSEEIEKVNERMRPFIKEFAMYKRLHNNNSVDEKMKASLYFVKDQLRELEDQRESLREKLTELEAKAQQYDLAINAARKLAIDVTIQAAKVYNKDRISPETIETTCRSPNSSTKTQILDMVDNLSNLFAEYFYDPTNQENLMKSILRRAKFFQAMKTDRRVDRKGRTKYGMKDVLTELEQKTELYESAAYIPDAFGNVMQVFYALGSNGNGSKGKNGSR
ncbi:MAG: hypothetical protein KAT43_00975 [Nanoarchaeota archaeon]|nr:hypothetical protein [Nanoarchaeota archaeon]